MIEVRITLADGQEWWHLDVLHDGDLVFDFNASFEECASWAARISSGLPRARSMEWEYDLLLEDGTAVDLKTYPAAERAASEARVPSAHTSVETGVALDGQPDTVGSTLGVCRSVTCQDVASPEWVNVVDPLYTQGVENGVTSEEGNIDATVTDDMRIAAANAAGLRPEKNETDAEFLARVNRTLGFAGIDLHTREFHSLGGRPGADVRFDGMRD